MPQSNNLIPGRLLLEKLGINIPQLSYMIIKFEFTVLEQQPKKFWLRSFLKPEYRKTDSEELLEIIQHDPEKLRYKLFLLSEIEKVPPHRVKPKDNGPSPCPAKIPPPQSDGSEPELESMGEITSISGQLLPLSSESLLKEAIEDHEAAIKNNPNVFSRLGRVWFIKFKNEKWGLYPDQEKYKYVANLLSLSSETTGGRKGEYAIHIVGLVARVKGNELPLDTDVKPDDEDLSHSYLSEEITKEEIGRIGEIGHQLLDQLREARKSQDHDRILKVQDIIAKYRSHLLKEYGMRTRVSDDEKRITFKSLHRSGKEIEKVRQLVKNQISNAVRDLSKHMPLFGKHLQHSLKTGSEKAVYSPEYPIAWTVST